MCRGDEGDCGVGGNKRRTKFEKEETTLKTDDFKVLRKLRTDFNQ